MYFHYFNQNSWSFFCSTLGVRYGREISASVVDCWKWSTVFRRNLEWKQRPEENVEKLIWNNEEISWSLSGRSGREQTNCEGLWCKCSKFLQSCPTLCDPMDHRILQARILEWVAILFSRGSSSPRDQTWVSRIAGRVLIIFWATRDYSTEVQNGEGMKVQGLQEGRVGKMQVNSYIHHSLCVNTSFLPPFLPSLSSFILLWESFLSSVEVLAFVAGSFLRGKFL